MEEVIDRGPLFKFTQDYNLNAIVSSNFHYQVKLPDAFFNITDTKSYPLRHYDQISVSTSLTYIEILEIIAKYTPKIIIITKRIRDDNNVPEISIDYMKLQNLTCFIYFFDLKLNFITKYFPNIKYLYVEKVHYSKSIPENFKHANLNNLELFSVNIVNKYAVEVIAPNLKELNLYCWENNYHTKKQTNLNNNSAHNTNPIQPAGEEIPVLDLDNYKMLRILRIDDNIKINLKNDTKELVSLQFMFHHNNSSNKNKNIFDFNKTKNNDSELESHNKLLKEIKGNFDSDYYSSLLLLIKPSEVILPPNIFNTTTIKKLKSLYKIQKCGIYISENFLINYFEQFPESLEIYDYNNLHASISLRYGENLSKYVNRTYTSVSPELQDIILGIQMNKNDDNNVIKDSITKAFTSSNQNLNNIICLTNFDLSNPVYNYKWMYIFHQIESNFKIKPIILTRCELVKPEKEFIWPSIVYSIKNRVIVMNLQKQSLHLDISIISVHELIKFLDNINGSFPFTTLVLITHGFNLTPTNIMQIKAHFKDAEITVQDVPYILYS